MAKSQNPDALRDAFLKEYNLTVDDILFEHREWESEEKAKSMLFTGDKNGDMRIYYPTLCGHLHRHNDKGRWADSFRLRKALPFINQKTNKEVKYLMQGNNVVFWPPAMVEAYRKHTPIDTLVVVEGEKKAFVASKNGWDICGISGIWNFCTKTDKLDDREVQGELLPELKEFIKVCKVKTVALLHDADALDISMSENKSATDRPFGFYQAVKRFAELILQEGCKLFYSYVNPHVGIKGLDDLIAVKQDVLHDFCEGLSENKFTSYFCTTRIQFISAHAIKEIFRLNDPEGFYKYHKARLKGKEHFRFDNRLFKIEAGGEKIDEVKTHDRESVWVTEGRYYGYSQSGQTKCISNFTMNVHFLLRSSTNAKRIVSFKNVLGQECIKELTMDDLVSVSNFRKKLIADGSYIYKGDMFELLNLQEILFKEEQPAVEITSLGWQKNFGFYAWSNGVADGGKFFPVDEFGIVTFGDHKYYLPAFSSLFTDGDIAFENERNFRHIDHDYSFEAWAQYFLNLYGKNGSVGISFYIASLFRDIIFGAFKEFPLLILFGQKGSGKSTMAKSIMSMFGQPQSAMSLENASSTKKGMYRKFGQFRNAVVWLDEYKNHIHPDLIGMLKNLFDGIGYERAQMSQDNRTISNPVLSSTILSGQDMPTADPALFTRGLLLMFKNNSFTDADKKNYSALTGLEKKGLTHITITLLGYRDLIVEHFLDEYKVLFARLDTKFKFVDIPDRLLKNAALVMAPVVVLMKHGAIDYRNMTGFSPEDLFKRFCEMLEQHSSLLHDNQEINVFWEVIETLYDEGILNEGIDFKHKQDCIAFRFNRVYSAYAEKYRKMHGRNGIDKMTITNYLKNSPAFVDTSEKERFEKTVTSAFVFKYAALGITLVRELGPMPKDPSTGSGAAPSTPSTGSGASSGAVPDKQLAINDNDEFPF